MADHKIKYCPTCEERTVWVYLKNILKWVCCFCGLEED